MTSTVDGSTQSIRRPAQSGGVSSPGATARAISPIAGNSRKVLQSTTAWSCQCRAPANAACGASRAPCRKNISAITAARMSLEAAMPFRSAGSAEASATMPRMPAMYGSIFSRESIACMGRKYPAWLGHCERRLSLLV